MAALGLVWGQMGIASTIYSDVMDIAPPSAQGVRMVHKVPRSTTYPTKELGHISTTISGVIKITAADVDVFVADVEEWETERKISWMLDDSTEVYVYSYSGDTDSPVCLNPYGTATRIYLVDFSFPLSRSGVYLASTDAVQWGA